MIRLAQRTSGRGPAAAGQNALLQGWRREDGQRACFMLFDMADSSQIPVISEPRFQSGRARITMVPWMNLEDLQKGLAHVR
jgi:hypothetical protein